MSPYFLVDAEGSSVDRLPLKSTEAQVDIAGIIAHVKVRQVYENQGSGALEAVYVFPGSTRAAVSGLRMRIGERTIEAKIRERDKARREYESARDEGRRASLLEQHRPNVFQMNVANIVPGDRVEVELDYTELLVPEGGTYKLVYPTTVGPRYTSGDSKSAWVDNPYAAQPGTSTYDWDLKARIVAGMPITAVGSPSHVVSPSFRGANVVHVDVDDPTGGNRDFVLRYRLTGDQIESGLLLHHDGKEGFFLLNLEPPKRLSEAIRPSRELVFIVDVSGSMQGFPLDVSKRLMRSLLEDLGPEDRFNLLLFSGGSTLLHPRSVEATPENIDRAVLVLEDQSGGGGTEILPALKKALAMPRVDELATSFVVVTDGYVDVEREAFEIVRNSLSTANLFAFGIGTSVNRHLIEGLAHVGMGKSFVVMSEDRSDRVAKKFRRYIDTPVLTRVKVDFDGFDAYDVVPESIPDVFTERPVVVFGKYRGKATGHIRVEGYNRQGRFSQAVRVDDVRPRRSNRALRQLWARHRIKDLSFMSESPEDSITRLGLRYRLMTEYTSFVAVDSVVANADSRSYSVPQSLPLPEGVSGGAISAIRRPVRRRRARRGKRRPQAAVVEILRGDKIEARHLKRSAPVGSEDDLLSAVAASPSSPRPATSRVSLDDAELFGVLRRNKKAIKRCIEKQQTADPTLEGAMTVRMVIQKSGRTSKVTVSPERFKDSIVGKCVIASVRTWRFDTFTGRPIPLDFPVRVVGRKN